MSTTIQYILNGQNTTPYRDAVNMVVSANFGLELQPSVSIDELHFLDSATGLNSQTVRTAWENNPVEGIPFSLIISNPSITIDFNFYLDYTVMKFLSDVETVTGAIKDGSIQSFDFRSQGITQRLLESKGLLSPLNFQNVPYIVENRKTLLERINLLFQGFILLKSISDEIFKLINISADITTLGAFQAAVNLTTTLAAITVQMIALKNLLEEIQEAFFPVVLYHAGIKPATFIEKGAEHMGYDGVEFGTLTEVMSKLTWLGSKNNQKGIPANILNPFSGILNPSDAGYNLFDAKELIKKQFRCREAIIDNVYHLRPEKDPFWVNSSTYILPSVKVENIPVNNGSFRPNYEDVNSSTILEYATDDSDLWTLDDLIDETDPNSTGKIITVVTVSPLVVDDQRKVLLKGSKNVDIPYSLCVRKDVFDELVDLFFGIIGGFSDMKQKIEDSIDSLLSILNASIPNMAEFIPDIVTRTGALKVENHFFSVPKMVYLEDNSQGNPRIPENFANFIGTTALYNDYHSWDSFIEGKRNPDNPTETAAKFVFEQIRIPFGLDDFSNILNNSYFSTADGVTGKFMKIDWNVRGDFAIVDYWIYNNWMTNIEENLT